MREELEVIEEELVYGARRRELFWQKLGLAGLGFGALGCLAAALVAILDVDPAPMIVPFDSETGMALPMPLSKPSPLPNARPSSRHRSFAMSPIARPITSSTMI